MFCEPALRFYSQCKNLRANPLTHTYTYKCVRVNTGEFVCVRVYVCVCSHGTSLNICHSMSVHT